MENISFQRAGEVDNKIKRDCPTCNPDVKQTQIQRHNGQVEDKHLNEAAAIKTRIRD